MKYLLIIILVALGFWFFFFSKKAITPSTFTQPRPSPTPVVAAADANVEIGQQLFAISLQELNPVTMLLIPNFTQKETSQTIFEKNSCTYGINGGFYTSEAKPLGLFYTKPEFLNPVAQTNTFLNGFLVKQGDTFDITTTQPAITPETGFVIQSGPVIVPGQKNNLNTSDEARRMLIGQTKDNQWYALAITQSENTFSGPTLAQLAPIFEKLNAQSEITFTKLINLDGGSASAFYNKQGKVLSELTSIGSFLCSP